MTGDFEMQAERWDSSLPHLLPNYCLDFSCDGWNSWSCIEQTCNPGDGHHPSSGWPTSSFVSVGEKSQVYLAKVLVWMQCASKLNPDTIMCLIWSSLILLTSLVAQMVKRLSTMQETRVRSLGWEDPLEKEMAIHSSIIAWKIPWTEELGRLQSMGSQRVGHDWATSLSIYYFVGFS